MNIPIKTNWRERFILNAADPEIRRKIKAKYEKSDEWKNRRDKVLQRAGGHCERCKKTFPDKLLQIHHLTYDHIGLEPLEDLRALCFECHQEADAEREENNRQIRFLERARAYAGDCWGELWNVDGTRTDEDAEELFVRAMYKNWCKANNRRYEGDLFQIDEWFEDALRDGVEVEDIEAPFTHDDVYYL